MKISGVTLCLALFCLLALADDSEDNPDCDQQMVANFEKKCFAQYNQSPDITSEDQCCTLWKIMDCIQLEICEQCSKESSTSIVGNMRDLIHEIESKKCDSHSYGSLKCNWFQFKLIGPLFIVASLVFAVLFYVWGRFFSG